MPGDTPLVQFAWHNWVTSLLWHRLARRAAAPPCLSSGTSTRRLPFTPWCLGASCMHTACEQRRVWRAALLYVYPVLCVRSWTCVCAERVFLNTQLTSGLGSLGLAVSLYPVFAVQCAPEAARLCARSLQGSGSGSARPVRPVAVIYENTASLGGQEREKNTAHHVYGIRP